MSERVRGRTHYQRLIFRDIHSCNDIKNKISLHATKISIFPVRLRARVLGRMEEFVRRKETLFAASKRGAFPLKTKRNES